MALLGFTPQDTDAIDPSMALPGSTGYSLGGLSLLSPINQAMPSPQQEIAQEAPVSNKTRISEDDPRPLWQQAKITSSPIHQQFSWKDFLLSSIGGPQAVAIIRQKNIAAAMTPIQGLYSTEISKASNANKLDLAERYIREYSQFADFSPAVAQQVQNYTQELNKKRTNIQSNTVTLDIARDTAKDFPQVQGQLDKAEKLISLQSPEQFTKTISDILPTPQLTKEFFARYTRGGEIKSEATKQFMTIESLPPELKQAYTMAKIPLSLAVNIENAKLQGKPLSEAENYIYDNIAKPAQALAARATFNIQAGNAAAINQGGGAENISQTLGIPVPGNIAPVSPQGSPVSPSQPSLTPSTGQRQGQPQQAARQPLRATVTPSPGLFPYEVILDGKVYQGLPMPPNMDTNTYRNLIEKNGGIIGKRLVVEPSTSQAPQASTTPVQPDVVPSDVPGTTGTAPSQAVDEAKAGRAAAASATGTRLNAAPQGNPIIVRLKDNGELEEHPAGKESENELLKQGWALIPPPVEGKLAPSTLYSKTRAAGLDFLETLKEASDEAKGSGSRWGAGSKALLTALAEGFGFKLGKFGVGLPGAGIGILSNEQQELYTKATLFANNFDNFVNRNNQDDQRIAAIKQSLVGIFSHPNSAIKQTQLLLDIVHRDFAAELKGINPAAANIPSRGVGSSGKLINKDTGNPYPQTPIPRSMENVYPNVKAALPVNPMQPTSITKPDSGLQNLGIGNIVPKQPRIQRFNQQPIDDNAAKKLKGFK
jgi:hypothetical protein